MRATLCRQVIYAFVIMSKLPAYDLSPISNKFTMKHFTFQFEHTPLKFHNSKKNQGVLLIYLPFQCGSTSNTGKVKLKLSMSIPSILGLNPRTLFPTAAYPHQRDFSIHYKVFMSYQGWTINASPVSLAMTKSKIFFLIY